MALPIEVEIAGLIALTRHVPCGRFATHVRITESLGPDNVCDEHVRRLEHLLRGE